VTAAHPYAGSAPLSDPGFATAPLEDWLRGHVPGYAGPLALERFTGGQCNPPFKLRTPGAAYVMRSKPGPAASLLPSAHAIEREYRVLAALAGSAVPVPRVHGLCEDEAVIGRAFYVMECVEGRVLWDQALPDMEPAARRAIYDEANRVIAALHRIDPAAVGLADYGRPGHYIERQLARWSRQYRASETERIEAMERLMEWLARHVPPAAEARVVHGDFRLDNLILHPSAPTVSAVLDWELSTLGDPLADFAYHCLAWHIEPGRFRGIAGLDVHAMGIPGEMEYLRMYCERTGRDLGQVLEHWNYYLAFNLFRLAAILQGIARRVLDGTAASPHAAQEGGRARGLAELGCRLASRGN
jgi:aminoglycoside phosphotransferase (APT) family kinase protein